MRARIPRTRLRLQVQDLRPGEYSWVSSYGVHINPTGRVWVEKEALLQRGAGQQPWPEDGPHYRGDFRVQRQADGTLTMCISADDLIVPSREVWCDDEYKKFEPISGIELLGAEVEPCPTCRGSGWKKQ